MSFVTPYIKFIYVLQCIRGAAKLVGISWLTLWMVMGGYEIFYLASNNMTILEYIQQIRPLEFMMLSVDSMVLVFLGLLIIPALIEGIAILVGRLLGFIEPGTDFPRNTPYRVRLKLWFAELS